MAKLEQKIDLIPFTPNNNYSVSCQLKIGSQSIETCFHVTGDIEGLYIPGAKLRRERKDKLWETTCFELFIGEIGKKEYLEVNVSPSGDWNVYSFTDYRQGMMPHKEISITDFFNGQNLAEFKAGFTVNTKISDLTLGVCAVLKLNSGENTYWALQHDGDKPDFHNQKARTKFS